MTPQPKALLVAGVMSGTSADGVDVALVRLFPSASGIPRLKILSHSEFPYPKAVREAVLRAASGEMKVAELSRLNWRLGQVYADCVTTACAHATPPPKLALVGMHGQTIYHQATAEKYAGQNIRATWQLGEAAVVAERLRVPVVSDFRPADMAAGGHAAPLVPMLDFCLFRSKTRHRVLLNLGGIANMTAIPAAAGLDRVIAFDSGPANMVIDALMQREFHKSFDRNGRIAARGAEIPGVVDAFLRDPWFAAGAPKSCGREQFGAPFIERFLAACQPGGASSQPGGASSQPGGADSIATATALTVRSIYQAYAGICRPHLAQNAPLARHTDLIASGGGTRNASLMSSLKNAFATAGVNVITTDDLGVASQAKEAVAFALLAWLRWHGLPGNVPGATGATRAVPLGKVSLG